MRKGVGTGGSERQRVGFLTFGLGVMTERMHNLGWLESSEAPWQMHPSNGSLGSCPWTLK